MKTLIYFDEQTADFQKSQYSGVVVALQSVVDAFNSLGLPQLTKLELKHLFTQTDDLIYDKMFEGKEKPHVLGVELNKHKAINSTLTS